MPDKKELLDKMDLVALERVARHFQDGAFIFDLDSESHTLREGQHCLPRRPALCGGGRGERGEQAAPHHGTGVERKRMKRAAILQSERYNKGNRSLGCQSRIREERSCL